MLLSSSGLLDIRFGLLAWFSWLDFHGQSLQGNTSPIVDDPVFTRLSYSILWRIIEQIEPYTHYHGWMRSAIFSGFKLAIWCCVTQYARLDQTSYLKDPAVHVCCNGALCLIDFLFMGAVKGKTKTSFRTRMCKDLRPCVCARLYNWTRPQVMISSDSDPDTPNFGRFSGSCSFMFSANMIAMSLETERRMAHQSYPIISAVNS